ncbi:unnamed protein product [Cuscuta campestris]|uniref:CCHC-type domain-containing protein n=1 Tax=Cuscuta campestris TaxID=132261 RepID=A0A484MDH9_9ASTE|nr:unnamed protein product [Cuscuta campestris]
MLQTAEESLTKGMGNSVLLVQGGKGKKKFKKAKKNEPKGKGNTEPKSNSSKLKPKGGVAKDSLCHHRGEVGHLKRNCKQYLATKKKSEASTSGFGKTYTRGSHFVHEAYMETIIGLSASGRLLNISEP